MSKYHRSIKVVANLLRCAAHSTCTESAPILPSDHLLYPATKPDRHHRSVLGQTEIKCPRRKLQSWPQQAAEHDRKGPARGKYCYPLHHTMYSTSSSAIPKSVDDDDRRRRGSETGVNNSQLPSISTRSPTHYLPYSPTNGIHPPSPYHTYSSRPSTSAAMPAPAGVSPRLGPPPSPKGAASNHGGAAYILRDLSSSTYYDPISEHREGPTSRNNVPYPSNSPVQVRYIYKDPPSAFTMD